MDQPGMALVYSHQGSNTKWQKLCHITMPATGKGVFLWLRVNASAVILESEQASDFSQAQIYFRQLVLAELTVKLLLAAHCPRISDLSPPPPNRPPSLLCKNKKLRGGFTPIRP